MDHDPAERLAYRLHQRMYLSHYASEPIDSWDDKPVAALEEAFRELNEMIKREGGRE